MYSCGQITMIEIMIEMSARIAHNICLKKEKHRNLKPYKVSEQCFDV
jgi:hypothetical protein